MKKLGLGLAALALAGCASHGTEHEHTFLRGVVPVTETDREARSMCSAVSYEEDHDRWLSYTTALREQVLSSRTAPNNPVSPGHADGVDPSRRSPELYGDPNPNSITDALYLISQFEAELDGSYDALVQNCRAYNQCMIRNDYVEDSCDTSARMWSDSQDRYHELAYDISSVRERVARSCADCAPDVIGIAGPHGGGHHGGGHHGGQGRPQPTPSSTYGPFDAGSR